MSSETPVIVFVCQKNAGKSQLAAALARAAVAASASATNDDAAAAGITATTASATIHSAGTAPGTALNTQSVESLAELGIDVGDEHPKPLSPELLRAADLVVVIGAEAGPAAEAAIAAEAPGTPVETWLLDEPSERGIEGMERMRLVRDEIRAHVDTLLARLRG